MTSKERKFGQLIEDKIYFKQQLDLLGISKTYTGYFMLIDILNELINEDRGTDSFSSEIYPIIAKKYNKKPSTVERNIRNLIDKCWTKDLMEKLNIYMPEGEKPTCRDFIFKIKNYIICQILN